MSGDGASAMGVISAIVFFLASASCLTVFNKWFLNHSQLQFKFAFMIGGTHQFLCFVYTLIFEHVFLEKLAGPITRKPKYFLILCPIGLLCAADWGASNFSLESVPLSLYEMIKSTTPMFTLIVSICFGLQPPAAMLISAIALISIGTYYSVVGGEGASSIFVKDFPLLGATVLLLGSLSSGFKAVVSQYVMQKVKNDEGKSDVNGVTMVFYTAPITSTCLFIMGSVVEGPAVRKWFHHADNSKIMWLFIELALSAVIAFSVTISAFMLMRVTSGLAYSVVKIAQRVGIVGLAIVLFHEHIGFYNGCGFFTALVGIALYNYYEIVHKKKHAAAAKEQEEKEAAGDDETNDEVDGDGAAAAEHTEVTVLVSEGGKKKKKHRANYGATN